jgi:hypothetical protein
MSKIKSAKKFLASVGKMARVPFQFMLSLVFIFHIFAMLFTTTPIRGPVTSRIQSFTSGYLSAAGTIQSWRMFISAPLIHSNKISVILTDYRGNTTELPPVIPGFRDTGKHFKEELFFARATNKRKWHLNQYLKKVCTLASIKEKKEFKKVHLLIKKEILQKTETIKKEGIWKKTNSFTYGETSCDS